MTEHLCNHASSGSRTTPCRSCAPIPGHTLKQSGSRVRGRGTDQARCTPWLHPSRPWNQDLSFRQQSSQSVPKQSSGRAAQRPCSWCGPSRPRLPPCRASRDRHRLSSEPFPALLPGLVLALAEETRFVGFDRTRKLLKTCFRPRHTQKVKREPCRPLPHLDFVGQLRGGSDRETGPAFLAPAGRWLSVGDFAGCSRSAMAAVAVADRPPHGFNPLDRELFIRGNAGTGEILVTMACNLATGGDVYPVASRRQVEILTLNQW